MSETKKVVINGETIEVNEAEDLTADTMQELSDGKGDDEE